MLYAKLVMYGVPLLMGVCIFGLLGCADDKELLKRVASWLGYSWCLLALLVVICMVKQI